MKRKAKIKEIMVWYKLNPNLSIWFTKMKVGTHIHKLPDETWYGGYWFNSGYFILIQLGTFAVHIKFSWWKIKF
jgi:hypothetical protein